MPLRGAFQAIASCFPFASIVSIVFGSAVLCRGPPGWGPFGGRTALAHGRWRQLWCEDLRWQPRDPRIPSSNRGTPMIFRQLFDQISGTYTYLIAGRRGGEALIIDPVLER